jgi:hypothetical protein
MSTRCSSRPAIDGIRARAAQSARATPVPGSSNLGHRGADGIVGESPEADRDLSATEPGRCRGTP